MAIDVCNIYHLDINWKVFIEQFPQPPLPRLNVPIQVNALNSNLPYRINPDEGRAVINSVLYARHAY